MLALARLQVQPARLSWSAELMELMGDHFWPSVYPGIVVGLLYGLFVGGAANALLGSIGGFAAAALALNAFGQTLSQDGLLPLAGLLGTALLGAVLAIRGAALLRRRRPAA